MSDVLPHTTDSPGDPLFLLGLAVGASLNVQSVSVLLEGVIVVAVVLSEGIEGYWVKDAVVVVVEEVSLC